MKSENKRKVSQYVFLAGNHLNPDRELILKITPADAGKIVEHIEISIDEYEGVYNQDRLILLVKGDLQNGIELAKNQKEEISEGVKDEKRIVKIRGTGAMLRFSRTPYLLHPIVIRATKGKALEKGQRALYHISQLDRNGVVGGVSVIFQAG